MPDTKLAAIKKAGEVTAPEATRGGIYFTPRVDIRESADEVVLECDIPGCKPEDVDVRFERGELSLHGKVPPPRVAAEYLRQEYGVGDFYRNFAISTEIDSEKISAEYRDGVLTVRLPKQERAKPRRIAIKIES
jgi:HSP20 family protein